MTVNSIGTALANQNLRTSIESRLAKMDDIEKQVQSQRKHEKIYQFSPQQANEVINISQSIFDQQSNLEVLEKGLRKANEMSNELKDLRIYLQQQLKSWQEQSNPTNHFSEQEKERFASNLLSGLENFLNKKSMYDGTFLFAGESVNTKPISTTSSSTDADNYYNGSTQNTVFNYNSKQIELEFNAGDISIKDLVTLFADIKRNGDSADGSVIADFEKCIYDLTDAKKRIDLTSRDLLQLRDIEKSNLDESQKSYSDLTFKAQFEAITELEQVSQQLTGIYTSIRYYSSKLLDFLR
ncbi:hypothetical protein [Candidatus Aquarickettsia rohweri]|uniref:Uncharacterized protein n=1 Tax=Candidatus Aquarickettsia rohweri TaxID=2602574 RepID=A0A3S0AA44_9RICK|nr:hypothetical protein [Candidatus Aquarickettsia rohweri]RST68508.1 hypothetical protein EIC27_02755 [Candidatus Aquarickettsia rohweri]